MILTVVCLILTFVFYAQSIQEIKGYGDSIEVANIQMTVFTGAAAVLTGVNFVGWLLSLKLGDLLAKLNVVEANLQKQPIDRAGAKSTTVPRAAAPVQASAEQEQGDQQITAPGKSDDDQWKPKEEGKIQCPICGETMTADFIRFRKQCPTCGTPFLDK